MLLNVTLTSKLLANLTTSDYQIILNPTGWLTCDIVQKAQVLLHEENQLIEGFQRPTLGPVRNFDVNLYRFYIQVLLIRCVSVILAANPLMQIYTTVSIKMSFARKW